MSGEVADYYSGDEGRSDDEGYPYSRTVFEASPLLRPIQQGLPGKDFAVTGSNSHVTKFAYGTNIEGTFGDDTCPSSQYYVQQTTDANGVQTYVLTNQLGQTVATKTGPIDGDGDVYKIVQYHYDSSGNLLKVQMPNYFAPPLGTESNNGDVWTIARAYDFLGRMTKQTAPDSGTTQYIYDKAGRSRFMMDAQGADPSQSGNTICYNKYDTLGRLSEDGFFEGDWGDGSTLQDKADNDPNWPDDTQLHTWRHQYTYDGDGADPNIIGMLASASSSNTDSTQGIEEVYAYDDYGNTISRSITAGGYDATPRTVGYTYDNLGNVTKITYPDGSQVPEVIYTYDRLGQLTGVGTPDNPATFSADIYTADGAPDVSTFNGEAQKPIQRTVGYNSPGWPTSAQNIFTDETSTAMNQSFTYTSGGYGDTGYFNGELAGMSFQGIGSNGDAYDYMYQHDNLSRMQVAQNTMDGDASVGVDTPLAYDANGNILTLERGQTTDIYNYAQDTNQVNTITENGTDIDAYSYNLNGDVTSGQRRNISQIDYDPLTRLTTAIQLNPASDDDETQTVSFQYESGGQRVIKSLTDDATGDAVSAKFYIHGLNAYPLIEEVRQDGGASEQTQYIYGSDGLLAMYRDGNRYTVLADNEGSVRMVLDDAGTVVAAFDYMPFGDLIGTPGGTNPDIICYRYTGQEYDTETQLYNYRARLYDSRLGRFYAVDPAGQYFNPYSYAGDDPLDQVDPDGEWAWGIIAVSTVVGAIGGAVSAGIEGKSITSNGFWEDVGIGAAAGFAAGAAMVGFGVLAAGSSTFGVAATAAGASAAQMTASSVTAIAIGGAVEAGGIELGSQLVENDGVDDWGAVGMSAGFGFALGGLTAGVGQKLGPYVASSARRGMNRMANSVRRAFARRAFRVAPIAGAGGRRGGIALGTHAHTAVAAATGAARRGGIALGTHAHTAASGAAGAFARNSGWKASLRNLSSRAVKKIVTTYIKKK